MTGDNHIGLRYASHERAEQLVEARISAFDGMVRTANSEHCSLFVITGDLFEHTDVPKRDVRAVLEKLSLFRGTVAVLPGNHDYYGKDVKVWQYFREIMQTTDNILLLSECRPYEVAVGDERAVLYPALCTMPHSEKNNLDWIRRENIPKDGVYRVGIAHGAVEGETIDNEGRYFLMRRDELERIPVDVWLIGHTHVPFPRDLRTDAYAAGERIFNAGTHVQRDVHNNTEGCCFLIEIGEDKIVRAKKTVSGNLRFYRREIPVKAGEMQHLIEQGLADIGDRSVVDLTVSGAVSQAEYEARQEIAEGCLRRFLESSFDDTDLTKMITSELIGSEFPETSFSANFLKALLPDPKEAQLAYDLLKSLREGR